MADYSKQFFYNQLRMKETVGNVIVDTYDVFTPSVYPLAYNSNER